MRKDLQEIRKNGYVIFSIIFVPIILVFLSVFSTVPLAFSHSSFTLSILTTFSSMMVLIPAIITSLMGSTSVIMEKTNHNLEPLLATPVTDSELLAGKALAPLSLGMLMGWIAYASYMGIIDAITYPQLGYFIFPKMINLIQMFMLIPVISTAGTFATLLISSKVNDVRAAQQLSAVVVLPVMLIIFVPIAASGSDLLFNIIIGVILLLVSFMLFITNIKVFRRENILIAWGK